MKEVHRRGRQLKSFSIGLNENSPDLIAARQVADFLKTEHYEFYFTLEVSRRILQIDKNRFAGRLIKFYQIIR